MTEEARARRATKKPAWLLDNVEPSIPEDDGEVKRRPQYRRICQSDPSAKGSAGNTKPAAVEKYNRHDLPRRMCLNPACKSPFESPQWRRGPLGPGTLCNACGTRYARIEARKRGDKKGSSKLRPQDLAEWQAFEEQLQHPPDVQQAWRTHTSRLISQLQGLHQCPPMVVSSGCDVEAEQPLDCDGDQLESYGQQQAGSDQEVQLFGQGTHMNSVQGLVNNATAVPASDFDFAGSTRGRRQEQNIQGQPATCTSPCLDTKQQTPLPGRLKRRPRKCDEDASDSQEAAACSYQDKDEAGPSSGSRRAETREGRVSRLVSAGDQFLHLLAVGEAMIKTEGVAPEDRKEAWAEYVEKRLPVEQYTHQASQSLDAHISAKRSRLLADVAHPEHASSSIAVPPKERFERLLAEAEQCIRARSASPLLRPLTPQHDVGLDSSKLEQNAIVRLPAATTCIATAAGGSSAAAQSPLTQVSQLHRFRGQERSQGPLLPPLELPAAATTTTSAPGSRLRAGGLLGTSAAAAQHCIAGVSNDKVQELKQLPADDQTPDSKLLLADEELESSPGTAEQVQGEQQEQPSQMHAGMQERQQLALQHQEQDSPHLVMEQSEQRLQPQPQPAQHTEQQRNRHSSQAQSSQGQSTEWLHEPLQRLLSDGSLCTLLSWCLSSPVTTSWLRELVHAHTKR